MKILLIPTLVLLSLTAALLLWASEMPARSDARTPILVELFTSEGCSSCPPADAFLQRLDRQPIAGADMIVLGEHVDYWNHIGWKDPYSARFFSDRQGVYARRLGLESVYTPQMVVDGTNEFVGSDAALADKAFAKALNRPKISIRLSSVSLAAPNDLSAHLETGLLPAPFGLGEVHVYVAVAVNHAESHVSHGENAGRTLVHVAVARSIVRVGTLRAGQVFSQDVRLKLDPGSESSNLRLIAFVQEPDQGRVIGVASEAVGTAAAAR